MKTTAKSQCDVLATIAQAKNFSVLFFAVQFLTRDTFQVSRFVIGVDDKSHRVCHCNCVGAH